MFPFVSFSRLWNKISVPFLALAFFVQPVVVLAAAEEKKPEWVLSYALVLLCIGLAIAILLRHCKRSETTFNPEEQTARKEEALKKLKNH